MPRIFHVRCIHDARTLWIHSPREHHYDPTSPERKKRGPMKLKFCAAVAAMLAAILVVPQAHAGQDPPPVKKHRRAAAPPKPSVEDQIEKLRLQLQTQIDTLKSDLSDKDAQLRQAQQQAADAQAAAARAQAAADAQQQSFTQNAAAVSTLQSTVDDMKQSNAAVVSSLTEQT